MTGSDVPQFTETEKRAILYIYETNQYLDDAPAAISTLVEHTDLSSRYYTRAWKSLQPRGIIDRQRDGRQTRLQLTEKGRKAAQKLMELNEVLQND